MTDYIEGVEAMAESQPFRDHQAFIGRKPPELEPRSKPISKYELAKIAKQLRKLDRLDKRIAYKRGQLLYRVWQGLRGKGFVTWLKENCGYSVAMAYNYIAIYCLCYGRPEVLDYIEPTLLANMTRQDFSKHLASHAIDNAEKWDKKNNSGRKLKAVNEVVMKKGFSPELPEVQQLFTDVGEMESLGRDIQKVDSEIDRLESAWDVLEDRVMAGFSKIGGKDGFTEKQLNRGIMRIMKAMCLLGDYEVIDESF